MAWYYVIRKRFSSLYNILFTILVAASASLPVHRHRSLRGLLVHLQYRTARLYQRTQALDGPTYPQILPPSSASPHAAVDVPILTRLRRMAVRLSRPFCDLRSARNTIRDVRDVRRDRELRDTRGRDAREWERELRDRDSRGVECVKVERTTKGEGVSLV